MRKLVLIDGRFELLNGPDRIAVFDVKKDGNGEDPVVLIGADAPKTDRDAGTLALETLANAGFLTPDEYSQYVNKYLASHPMPATREKSAARHKRWAK